MKYSDFEFSETDENSELLEDGILLERIRCERSDAESADDLRLFGTPLEDTAVWSKADSDCADGLMCEKYIAELLTGDTVSENDILSSAHLSGEFDTEYGCTKESIGNLLENMEIDVSRESEISLKDICMSLDNNEKVICEISSIVLKYPDMADFPGISADHFVQVIGIDETDPEAKKVILNDPFDPEGGTAVAEDIFMDAWEKSSRFAVFAK